MIIVINFLQVRIAIHLTEAGIKTKDIVILTPYNAQVASINEFLFDKNIRGITVNTIMRSQGNNNFHKCHFTSVSPLMAE